MNMKDIIFRHIEKVAFGIAICYLIYTAVDTFFLLSRKTQRIEADLLSLSGALDKRLKTSAPQALDMELKSAEQLSLRLTTPPSAGLLPRPYIFGKFIKEETVSDVTIRDLLKKPETQIAGRPEDITPGEMEFVFKGGTAEMALIQVRKLYNDRWWVESFVLGKREPIGKKKSMGKETVDFDTRCKLIEIVPQAQKPFIIRKTTLVQNEKGEFQGSASTEETHMISASKIIFEDMTGNPYNLWIGEVARVGTDTVTLNPSAGVSPTN